MNTGIIKIISNKFINKIKAVFLSPAERIASLPYSEESISELYDIFNSIKGCLPIVTVTIDKGNYIYRQRRNEVKDFHYISELSYPPADIIKTYGRSNIPNNPMFYGCIFSEKQPEYTPFKTSIMEISEIAKDNNKYGIERTTCSIWEVKDEIVLFAFPFSGKYQKPASEIVDAQKKWKDFKENGVVGKKNLDLMLYMSNEITKEASSKLDYIKTSNFIYFLLNKHIPTINYDGIIYPSVYMQGEGFNVALKPNAVDSKLQFKHACCCYLIKKQEKPNEVNVDIVSYSVGLNKDGQLTYEQASDFDKNKYKDMIFIN